MRERQMLARCVLTVFQVPILKAVYIMLVIDKTCLLLTTTTTSYNQREDLLKLTKFKKYLKWSKGGESQRATNIHKTNSSSSSHSSLLIIHQARIATVNSSLEVITSTVVRRAKEAKPVIDNSSSSNISNKSRNSSTSQQLRTKILILVIPGSSRLLDNSNNIINTLPLPRPHLWDRKGNWVVRIAQNRWQILQHRDWV